MIGCSRPYRLPPEKGGGASGNRAGLFRAYNRYMGEQCGYNPKRLKWGGLLPLRDAAEGTKAIEEMQRLGAVAAVVFGTAGKRLLSDASFTPVWD